MFGMLITLGPTPRSPVMPDTQDSVVERGEECAGHFVASQLLCCLFTGLFHLVLCASPVVNLGHLTAPLNI